jgi:hypothetical protein
MTPAEFVLWLKGFVAGSSNYNLTPGGWDEVKEKLNTVTDAAPITFNFGSTSTSTATTLPPDATINYTVDSKTLLHD